jgi:hypothetical protein
VQAEAPEKMKMRLRSIKMLAVNKLYHDSMMKKTSKKGRRGERKD